MTLVVILLVVVAMAGLSWLVYRRPSGHIDHDQLPEVTTRFRDRDSVDVKAPWNGYTGPGSPWL